MPLGRGVDLLCQTSMEDTTCGLEKKKFLVFLFTQGCNVGVFI